MAYPNMRAVSHRLPDVPVPSFAIADRSTLGTAGAPSWLPSDMSLLVDTDEFAAVPPHLSKELDTEADALGVYLAAYRHAADRTDKRPQLCRCLEVADLGIGALHRLTRLETRHGIVLVAYARPLSLRDADRQASAGGVRNNGGPGCNGWFRPDR